MPISWTKSRPLVVTGCAGKARGKSLLIHVDPERAARGAVCLVANAKSRGKICSLQLSRVLLNIGFGQNGNACELAEGMKRFGMKSGALHALAIKGAVLIRVSKQFPEALELQSFHLGLGKKLAPVELFKVSGVCRMIAPHPPRKNKLTTHPRACP